MYFAEFEIVKIKTKFWQQYHNQLAQNLTISYQLHARNFLRRTHFQRDLSIVSTMYLKRIIAKPTSCATD